MSWRLVTFEALDVLVSADARPLGDGGWGHDGEISPAAFAGCLRTLILRRAGYRFGETSQTCTAEKAAEVIGLGLDSGFDFRFAGPLLLTEGGLLFPAPRTLLFKNGLVQDRLGPTRDDGRLRDAAMDGLELLGAGRTDGEPAEGWMGAGSLAATLKHVPDGGAPWDPLNVTMQRPGDLIHRERRFGHERSDHGVVAEGKLFSRGVLRFSEKTLRSDLAAVKMAGLLRGVGDDLFPAGAHTARLAGDGHLARIEMLSSEASEGYVTELEELRQKLPGLLEQFRGLTLYLATPAIFENGWRPESFEQATGLALRAAAVGKPRIIGGWDWKKKRPKRLWRAVPAGSVYFFELPEDADSTVIDTLVKTYFLAEAVTDAYGNLGFGLAVLGAWDGRRRNEEATDG